jgi:hypothetical protein
MVHVLTWIGIYVEAVREAQPNTTALGLSTNWANQLRTTLSHLERTIDNYSCITTMYHLCEIPFQRSKRTYFESVKSCQQMHGAAQAMG